MKIGINAFLNSFPVSFEPAKVDVKIIETVTKIIPTAKNRIVIQDIFLLYYNLLFGSSDQELLLH